MKKKFNFVCNITKNKMKKIILENIKTIFYALVIAILIRSLLLQPFYIPSSSMEPSLLVGDRLFVTKLSYGYSKHSFPFSLGPIKNRIFFLNQKEEMLLYLKPQQIIELTILKDYWVYQVINCNL